MTREGLLPWIDLGLVQKGPAALRVRTLSKMSKLVRAKPKNIPEKTTSDVLTDSLTAVVEAVTGVAASSRTDIALSIGHLFQRLRGGEFLSALLREWNTYRKKGRVKEDLPKNRTTQSMPTRAFEFSRQGFAR
jgi:hypothetical protein